MTTQQKIAEINKKYPVMSIPIKYRSSEGVVQDLLVRFPAEIMENGRPVIWLEGIQNAVDIKDVEI